MTCLNVNFSGFLENYIFDDKIQKKNFLDGVIKPLEFDDFDYWDNNWKEKLSHMKKYINELRSKFYLIIICWS